MPGIYVAAILAVLLKTILVFATKGLDLPALILSFFKVYSASQRKMTTNKKRLNYMRFNNYLNFFLFGVFLLFVIMWFIFQDKMFTY
jgi:hypothetical protein